jgi:hypothetical protein
MAIDLFERLADLEVPPAPASEEFDRQLHERVNRSLVTAQLVDLGAKGLPFALLHFLRAFVGFLSLTLTGRYDAKPKNGRR